MNSCWKILVEFSSPRNVGLSHEGLEQYNRANTEVPLTERRDPLISGKPAASGRGGSGKGREPKVRRVLLIKFSDSMSGPRLFTVALGRRVWKLWRRLPERKVRGRPRRVDFPQIIV